MILFLITLDTENYISKKPIDQMSDKIRSRFNDLNSHLIELIKSSGLDRLKDGSGSISYDGFGLDYESRRIDLFFYFKNNRYGKSQISKCISRFNKLEKELSKAHMNIYSILIKKNEA
jgi:hypothetical protein